MKVFEKYDSGVEFLDLHSLTPPKHRPHSCPILTEREKSFLFVLVSVLKCYVAKAEAVSSSLSVLDVGLLQRLALRVTITDTKVCVSSWRNSANSSIKPQEPLAVVFHTSMYSSHI